MIISLGSVASMQRRIVTGVTAALSWRVRWIAAESGPASLATMQMSSSIGGANECTGGTAIAISGSGGITSAFDADLTSFWTGPGINQNVNFNSWIGYRFSSPRIIAEIKLTSMTGNNAYLLCMPYAGVIESSNDEITWTPIKVFFPSTPWTAGQTQTITVGNTLLPTNDINNAIAWRAYITETSGSYPNGWATAREIEFAIVSAGIDQCTGGAAFSSTAHGVNDGASPGKAFDNNTSTEWNTSQNWATPSFIGYVRPTPFIPVEIRWAPGSDGSERPVAFQVQWSSNLATWNTYSTKSGITNSWTTGTFRTFSLP